jgi:hypothetical protein
MKTVYAMEPEVKRESRNEEQHACEMILGKSSRKKLRYIPQLPRHLAAGPKAAKSMWVRSSPSVYSQLVFAAVSSSREDRTSAFGFTK